MKTMCYLSRCMLLRLCFVAEVVLSDGLFNPIDRHEGCCLFQTQLNLQCLPCDITSALSITTWGESHMRVEPSVLRCCKPLLRVGEMKMNRHAKEQHNTNPC